MRRRLGEAGAEWARREHDLDRVAESYAEVLELAAGGDAVADAVLGELAEAAAGVGLDAGSPELAEIAARARELRIVP